MRRALCWKATGCSPGDEALAATTLLKRAFRSDVEPILAAARAEAGGAIDAVATCRASRYRARVAALRPAVMGAGGRHCLAFRPDFEGVRMVRVPA